MKVYLQYLAALATILALSCSSKPLEVPEDQTESMRLNCCFVGTLPNGKKLYSTLVKSKSPDDIEIHCVYFTDPDELKGDFLFYKGKYRSRKVVSNVP